MDALLVWFAAAAVVALAALAILKWTSDSLTVDIIAGVQGLVDKMKEYDLDTRAGLRRRDRNEQQQDAQKVQVG